MMMSILIGISLPYFKGMQDEGNVAKAAGELRTLGTAIESFYIHNNEYPVQAEAASGTSDWQTDANSLSTASPMILRTALTDPFKASQEYSYATSASSGSQYYVIFSVGPDGTADITGINTSGVVQPTDRDDDIYFSNGTSGTGGF